MDFLRLAGWRIQMFLGKKEGEASSLPFLLKVILVGVLVAAAWIIPGPQDAELFGVRSATHETHTTPL